MLRDGKNTAIATTVTTNVFLGQPSEFMGQASTYQLFVVSDLPSASMSLVINVGGSQLAPISAGSSINVTSTAGGGPKFDEDLVATFAVPAGARCALNVTNNNGSTNNVRYANIIQ